MKVKSKWLLFGSIAFYILAGTKQDVSRASPMPVVGSFAQDATLSAKAQNKRSQLVQQTIQNGEFNPPGNVGTISPFGQVTQTRGTEATSRFSGIGAMRT